MFKRFAYFFTALAYALAFVLLAPLALAGSPTARRLCQLLVLEIADLQNLSRNCPRSPVVADQSHVSKSAASLSNTGIRSWLIESVRAFGAVVMKL